MRVKVFAIPLFILLGSTVAFGRDLSPFLFGLDKATSDIERYNVLYRTHVTAIERGVDVDYSGIDSLSIEIPNNSQPIPLTKQNDFKGLRLFVNNHFRRQAIFQMVSEFSPIEISKTEIESGEFENNLLKTGLFLLAIEDTCPWVEQRRGYKYGHQRKDLLLVKNGRSVNQPIASYCTQQSKPCAEYLITSSTKKYIKNINIIRSPLVTKVPICIHIVGQNNVEIENITINTPKNTLYMDAAIAIEKSANINVKNIVINGTYSQKKEYGYGFLMDNVWNSSFTRIRTKSEWGVFGNNNINKCTIKDSKINRFDIHCYGKDIAISNCEFYDLYNQFSSLFGYLKFTKCSFTNFTPVLFESTYNAYTSFDLFFYKCIFYPNKQKNYIINAGFLDEIINTRQELNKKQWPNVSIKKLTISPIEPIDCVFLFYLRSGKVGNATLDGDIEITVKDVDFKHVDEEMDLKVTNHKIQSKQQPVYKFRRVKSGNIETSGIQ